MTPTLAEMVCLISLRTSCNVLCSFGVINEILGAFTVTFETYIIPCLAFNIHYGYKRFSASHQIDSPKQLSP